MVLKNCYFFVNLSQKPLTFGAVFAIISWNGLSAQVCAKPVFKRLIKFKGDNMYKIIRKQQLNPTVTMMDIYAPMVAAKAEPGQFIILRVDDKGERIPLTIAGYDREAGTVNIIFQIVGATTNLLNQKKEGEYIQDFAGPLGTATKVSGLKKVCIVGGGVGCAISLPIAQKLHELGCEVHSIIGFRSRDLVILEEQFAAASDKLILMTDDGSHGDRKSTRLNSSHAELSRMPSSA